MLSKKCIHASGPLAGPLSKQSSAFCAAAEVKSQLATGSRSRRTSGHACGQVPGGTSHVWANSFEPMLLYDFTPHSSPPRNSLSKASEKGSASARSAHLEFHSKAMRSAQRCVLSGQAEREQCGQVMGGCDEAFHGQRNGSLDPSPACCALSHSR